MNELTLPDSDRTTRVALQSIVSYEKTREKVHFSIFERIELTGGLKHAGLLPADASFPAI